MVSGPVRVFKAVWRSLPPECRDHLPLASACGENRVACGISAARD
jgi:hypothetical protein